MPQRQPGKTLKRSYRSAAASAAPRRTKTVEAAALRSSEATSQDEKVEAVRLAHGIDEKMGFERFESGKSRVGWLVNMQSTTLEDTKNLGGRAGVDYYFLQDDGGSFKATVEYDPYFLVAVRRGKEPEVEEWVKRKLEGVVKSVKRLEKEDLTMPNHLLGYKRGFLELRFQNVTDLLAGRKEILPIAERNRKNMSVMDAYVEVASAGNGVDIYDDELDNDRRQMNVDPSDNIVDIREYDVPYHVRVAIDKDIRIGKWYTVESRHGLISLKCLEDRLQRADPVVLAYDIETTKLPLKFPDSSIDQVMMISYMIDGRGFLITNREIVSEDISDFDYSPKPEYPGKFVIFNEPDERAVLERFFAHIKDAKPTVIATYNGDFFDWPFVEARASILGIDMYQEIGFRKNSEDIYQSNYCAHLDCFAWVNRDSYLPQGSRGLKAVTTAKLGYDPDEIDPELMTPYAREKPHVLAEYSVSDAIATYYLYMKYIHPFIFSLCTILPLNPDDTLRKGTGTLCEMLLMVQAYQKNIVIPNKHVVPPERFYEGHLLEAETYVGGHVESIEAGVFRSDIPTPFTMQTSAIDELLHDLDDALKFTITVEEKKSLADVVDYEEVKASVVKQFEAMKENPNRTERPLIYHLDVASMYPNIMTTNRLQPDSMIQESDCAACDFNRPGKTCDRRMPWSWRGEYYPIKKNEYNMLKHGLETERFPVKANKDWTKAFSELSLTDQTAHIKKRVSDYSKKIYNRLHETKIVEKETIICQRENPFYVHTVRDFRDRRYDYKGQQKVWKGKAAALKSSGAPSAEVDEAGRMIVLYDSLQLAHKVILNSFYGYVMRKGSRWYSLEMAGITCLTGARIIQMARELVERLGRPLELDTDGIWCMLPESFPEEITFTLKNGKKLKISYPCTMLNHLVHQKFTNHQYQTLADPETFRYETHSDNTIFFEVDGPYKAMILPTSKEEDKNLKKRYAVYNHDGSLAELKGFELKRRGELKLIKTFQKQIFKFFLNGETLPEVYEAVARVANEWLDVLDDRASTLAEQELVDLICENKSMAKTVAEYGAQKSTAITTAKRLAEFLGEQMIKDKGLNCQYIIAAKPNNAPVTERAIPVAIFSSEETTRRHFLRKWLREDPGTMELKDILDWGYYIERLGGVIQKLITIPAALQHISNPVPRIAHPDWLEKRVRGREDTFKQQKMTDMFQVRQPLAEVDKNSRIPTQPIDLEDFGSTLVPKMHVPAVKPAQKRKSPEPVPTSKDPYASLPTIMPDIKKDYAGFIEYQKKKWAIQKEARKRRRELFGEQSSKATDIGGLFREKAAMQFTGEWQLLQLRETDVPGTIRAFVLIENKIHSMKVKVPRVLYLNAKYDKLPNVTVPGCEVEVLNSHTLPNGHASKYLFKLSMEEETYVQEQKKMSLLFNHKSIEGVYEKNVPLSVRAVLRLGSTCTLDQSQHGVLGRSLENGFDLASLVKPETSEAYLAQPILGYYYIYHITHKSRQVFALFSTTHNEATIIIQDDTTSDPSLPVPDRIYRESLLYQRETRKANQWQKNFDYPESIQFTTTHVRTLRKANLALGFAVRELQKDENRPMMLVIQSSQHQRIAHDLPSLKEMPILTMNLPEADREWPSLGWQSFIVKRITNNYLALGSWIDYHVNLARYGDVPMCNLDYDDPRFLIDVAYARRLQQNNVILWWSAGPLPDHAGYEKDNIVAQLEKVEPLGINVPGTYSSVCVEVSVRNLITNTILCSDIVNNNEGLPDHEAGEDLSAFSSPTGFASAGVRVLREMVQDWLDISCQGNNVVDAMVEHVVSWVQSPSSFLYDQALDHYVKLLTKKAFQQLTLEFRRVGSHIVYAGPHRLLLQTTKGEIGNAYAYADYILTAIKSKPLFSWLDLEVKEFWDYLVWYDQFNYGGKCCFSVTEEYEQPVKTVMHWQLSSFLPHLYQEQFDMWVSEYIDRMHQLKRPQTNRNGPPRLTQLPFRALTKERASDLPLADTLTCTAITETIGMPLRRQLVALAARYRTELHDSLFASDHTYPIRPGSHLAKLPQISPVLQLAKSIIHVFSLDKSLELPVRQLHREFMTIFEVHEFSPEGRFENPSASLVVERWACDNCGHIADLDLCRDEAFVPMGGDGESEAEVGNAGKVWACVHCTRPYSRLAMQESLVRRVHEIVVRWSTQDIVCAKCKNVRCETNEWMDHCGCGGEWKGTQEKKDLVRELKVLRHVSGAYKMALLEGVVKDVEALI